MLAVYVVSRLRRIRRTAQDQAEATDAKPNYVPPDAFFAMRTMEHPTGIKVKRVKIN
jgi:hypothetical protein